MNKKLSSLLYTVSILMIGAFIVLVLIDYLNYNPMITSAPFYVNILLRAVEFILPAFVFACIGNIYNKKNK